MAIFFVIGLMLAQAWWFGDSKGRESMGEPSFLSGSKDRIMLPYQAMAAALVGQPFLQKAGARRRELSQERTALLTASLKSAGDRFALSLETSGSFLYRVKRGDVLSRIARNFGVSVQEIIRANPGLKIQSLRIGQEIKIPVVGKTAQSVPQGGPVEGVLSASALSSERNLEKYFIQPAEGLNWGRLHPKNAVDIANICGTLVVAAAEGLVVDASAGGWNAGYGSYLVLEHPNGVKTLYAHLSKVSVSIGDYVEQGEEIGAIGKTGEATGCHLHFEVEGAQNPFAAS